MPDLMEIDDEEMLSHKPAMGGLQPSKWAPTAKPKGFTENSKTSGLMASKYATSVDDSATEGGRVGKSKAQSATSSNTSTVDFWQEPLPRAVKDIITKGKVEPSSSAKKGPDGLAKSRWAN